MTKTALCRVSDTEPLLSLIGMLGAVGYRCVLPNRELRNLVRDLGGNNVDEFEDMHRRWGADMPPRLPEVGPDFLGRCDLYVDVCACRNARLLWERPNFGRLRTRSLCYFINGGPPRDTPDKGDNVAPECPVLTTNQFYREDLWCPGPHWNKEGRSRFSGRETRLGNVDLKDCVPGTVLPVPAEGTRVPCTEPACDREMLPAPWVTSGRSFVFLPTFVHTDKVLPRAAGGYGPAVSFVHNCMSWGCQDLVPAARALGVRAYGGGSSPDGLIPHAEVWGILQNALCVVYLKTGGAVDYSILEAMAAGCPVTVRDSYPDGTRLHDLLTPGETCLTFRDEDEIAHNLKLLSDPGYNREIGEAGRKRMYAKMWSPRCAREVREFGGWMARIFPD